VVAALAVKIKARGETDVDCCVAEMRCERIMESGKVFWYGLISYLAMLFCSSRSSLSLAHTSTSLFYISLALFTACCYPFFCWCDGRKLHTNIFLRMEKTPPHKKKPKKILKKGALVEGSPEGSLSSAYQCEGDDVRQIVGEEVECGKVKVFFLSVRFALNFTFSYQLCFCYFKLKD